MKAHELVIAPGAEADLAAAFEWYEQKRTGLGFEFLRCVKVRLELIISKPQIFRNRSSIHRMVMPMRFPYAIYYIWEQSKSRVVVRRVLHFAQNAEHELK